MTLEEFISEKGFGDCPDMFPILKIDLVFMNGEEEESYKTAPRRYERYLKHEIRRVESYTYFERGWKWEDRDEYFEILLYAEEDDKDD